MSLYFLICTFSQIFIYTLDSGIAKCVHIDGYWICLFPLVFGGWICL